MDPLTVRVCNLPRDLHRVRTKSAITLLREAGYLDSGIELSRESIIQVLHSDPSLIQEWLGYSADKRTSSGWFFLPNCRVGYFAIERQELPSRSRVSLQPIFNDLTSACAEFIIREMESFRSHARSNVPRKDRSNNDTNSSNSQT